MDSNNGQSWYNLGRIYYDTGDYQQAIEAFVKTIERNGQHPTFLKYLADSLAKAGRTKEANEIYKRLG